LDLLLILAPPPLLPGGDLQHPGAALRPQGGLHLLGGNIPQPPAVSDRNRNSHFRPKPNIRQLKTSEYSVSAEYLALFPTFDRKSLIYCIHTAKLVEFGQNLTRVSVFPYLLLHVDKTINSDQNTFRISGEYDNSSLVVFLKTFFEEFFF
jgi:hypothetical protein